MPTVSVPLICDMEAYTRNTLATISPQYYLQNCIVKKENGRVTVERRPGALSDGSTTDRLGMGVYYWANNFANYTITMEYDATGAVWKLYSSRATGFQALTGVTHTRNASHFSAAEIIHSGGEYLVVNAHSAFDYEQLYLISDHLVTTNITNATHGYPSGAAGNFPVPGVVELDGYIFSGFIDGKIYNCNLNNVTTWTATDFISAERRKDLGRYICKHNNNICFLGTESIEFFYNAGNPTGSPLARREDVYYDIGVITPTYLAYHPAADSNDRMVAFIGGHGQGENPIGIYLIENFKLRKISTPSIDKVLSTLDRIKLVDMDDRTLVLLNRDTSGDTYAYDTSVGLWYFFDFAELGTGDEVDKEITSASKGRFIWYDNGHINTFSYGSLKDGDSTNGYGTYYARIILPPWDGGTQSNKFIHSLNLIGDESVAATNMAVKWKDNLNESYNTARNIDLNSLQPIHRCGVTRRRFFHLEHHDTVGFKLEKMELHASGTDTMRDQS